MERCRAIHTAKETHLHIIVFTSRTFGMEPVMHSGLGLTKSSHQRRGTGERSIQSENTATTQFPENTWRIHRGTLQTYNIHAATQRRNRNATGRHCNLQTSVWLQVLEHHPFAQPHPLSPAPSHCTRPVRVKQKRLHCPVERTSFSRGSAPPLHST